MNTDRQLQCTKSESAVFDQLLEHGALAHLTSEDLEDLLAMMEALEVPEEEAITWDEYKRRRAVRVLTNQNNVRITWR